MIKTIQMEQNIFNLQYKLCLLKAYFDKGYGLTSYFKYVLFLVGLYSVFEKVNMKYVIGVGILYLTGCFFIGWVWYRTNFIRAEAEVANRFNYFQQEMRKKLKISDIEKFK